MRTVFTPCKRQDPSHQKYQKANQRPKTEVYKGRGLPRRRYKRQIHILGACRSQPFDFSVGADQRRVSVLNGLNQWARGLLALMPVN